MITYRNEEPLRPPAEIAYATELDEIGKVDDRPRPPNWRLSPWGVLTYLMGGKLANGFEVEPKYFGKRRLMEIAIATLATDRALLLLGVPGTAKTWVAEHLSAAISGCSTLLVQGTAGLSEEALRYAWNYAHLIAYGPSKEALVPSPIMIAMQEGKIARVEELTRIPSDVQDALITLLSEKILPVPELNETILAKKGFNLIATANDRDKGTNELSSALKRRFNTVVMPLPESFEEEVTIVKNRIESLGRNFDFQIDKSSLQEIQRVVTIFRELRNGMTEDGKTKLKSPTSTLSTAEAISVIHNAQALASHFGNGRLQARDLAAVLQGAIIKDPVNDPIAWAEYLEIVVKERKDWKDLYEACKVLL